MSEPWYERENEEKDEGECNEISCLAINVCHINVRVYIFASFQDML